MTDIQFFYPLFLYFLLAVFLLYLLNSLIIMNICTEESMNLMYLKYFVSIADTLSFTESSKRLFVSQPTLSHGISSLESELETMLFIRRHHSLELSESGKKLYAIATQIISLVNRAYDEVKPPVEPETSSLRIGFMTDLLPMCFKSVLSPFLQKHPEIKSHLDQNYVIELHNKLKNNKLDIIITRQSSLYDIPIPGSSTINILEDEFCLAIPVGHPAAKYDRLSDLSIFKDNYFVAMNPKHTSPLTDKLIRICSKRNYQPNFLITESLLDMVLAQVSSGAGITITPKSYLTFKDYPHIKVIELDRQEDIINNIVACYMDNNENPSLQLYKEFLTEDPGREKFVIG